MLWSLGPWGRPRLAVYLISACVILPCACVVFAVLWCGIVFLEGSGSWHFLLPNPNCQVYFYLFVLLIRSSIYLCFPPLSHLSLVWWVLRGGLEQDWVGQSDVLAPWGVVVAPGPLWHLTSICNRGVNLILSYLFIYVFIWNIYTGWLSSALK